MEFRIIRKAFLSTYLDIAWDMAQRIIGQDTIRLIFKRNMTYCGTRGIFDGSVSANALLGIFSLDSFFRHFFEVFGAQAKDFKHISKILCMDWGVMGGRLYGTLRVRGT
jgi:hypothetical protein